MTDTRAAVLAQHVKHLWPVQQVSGSCSRCLDPWWGNGADCRACATLVSRWRAGLDSFRVMAVGARDGYLHDRIRFFKQAGCPACRSTRDASPTSDALGLAALVSCALESQWPALTTATNATPVVGWLPTSRPVIKRTLHNAAAFGWWVPSGAVQALGSRAPGSLQARGLTAQERMRRTPQDWRVSADVRNRAVILIDDVYTTGASMHTFARALKDAGAAAVHAIVIERLVTGKLYERRLSLMDHPSQWRPDHGWAWPTRPTPRTGDSKVGDVVRVREVNSGKRRCWRIGGPGVNGTPEVSPTSVTGRNLLRRSVGERFSLPLPDRRIALVEVTEIVRACEP